MESDISLLSSKLMVILYELDEIYHMDFPPQFKAIY